MYVKANLMMKWIYNVLIVISVDHRYLHMPYIYHSIISSKWFENTNIYKPVYKPVLEIAGLLGLWPDFEIPWGWSILLNEKRHGLFLHMVNVETPRRNYPSHPVGAFSSMICYSLKNGLSFRQYIYQTNKRWDYILAVFRHFLDYHIMKPQE